MRFVVVTMVIGWSLLLAGCGADEGQNWPGDGTGDTGSPPADTAVDSLPADTGGGTDTMPPDTLTEISDPAWDEICGEEDLPLQYDVSSDVLIILDRSGSMMVTLGNVKTAVNAVVAPSDDKIWFGLMPFPNSVAPDECRMLNPFSECYPPVTPHVPLGPSHEVAIATALADIAICGSTPTSQTLVNAHAYLSGTLTGHDQFILLATDGVPNCNSDLDPATCDCPDPEGCEGRPQACLDDDATYAALDALLADGIPTYVLGVGAWAGADEAIMNEMAAHGGTGSFYPAASAVELLEAFEAIMGTVVLSCIFELHPGEDVDEDKVNLYVGGVIVPQDPSHVNGWDYIDEYTVEFYGDWCTAILSGDVGDVTASYGCPTYII